MIRPHYAANRLPSAVKSTVSAMFFGMALLLCATTISTISPYMFDFYTSFYPASNAWLKGSYTLYDGSFAFFSTPWMMGILLPFTAFPYEVSRVVWTAFMLLCIVISVRCFGKVPFYVAALAIVNQPMLNMLDSGQLDAIPLLGISLSYLAVKKGNAGLLSVAWFLIATKPPNLILPSLLLLSKGIAWRAVWLTILATVVSGFFVGMDWMIRYIEAVRSTPPPFAPETIIWRSPIPWPVIALAAMVSLFCFMLIAKRRGLTARTYSLGLATNLAFSPYALESHYIMLIPGFLLLSRNWLLAAFLYAMSWAMALFPYGNWVGSLYPLAMQAVALFSREKPTGETETETAGS